ncbi:hypothetical protein [Parasphingopyxis marina]|uniref:Bacteriocin n=1 Tax=Parasphingopyxis marina TaxID=2761622 RepID=A0A842I2E2_9SPHN|nr:hypothetical protein [Parasphingopyxis marina]MBC2777984.1 hypothetical protein [Parasphingopyxis marina]
MTKKSTETLSTEELDQVAGGADGSVKFIRDSINPSVDAAVPFHRVINNTVYGGGTDKGQDGDDLLIVNNGDGSDF